ncbi:hypothetical protein [Devosia limi]|uniref:hypothetical protein n=1 Tax=Devosia limi TaxID=288995 RepID=UPI0011606032|nr:hypothetical protein [Devosia limi]
MLLDATASSAALMVDDEHKSTAAQINVFNEFNYQPQNLQINICPVRFAVSLVQTGEFARLAGYIADSSGT